MKYQLEHNKQEFVMHLSEWIEKYEKVSNKCERCGKHYKLPNSIFEPRDKICFSCEFELRNGMSLLTYATYANLGDITHQQ